MKTKFGWLVRLVDVIMLWLALGLAYGLRQYGLTRRGMAEIQGWPIYVAPMLAAAVWLVVIMGLLGLYTRRSYWFGLRTQYRLITGVLLVWLITMMGMYLSKYDFSRSVILLSLVFSLMFIYVWRLGLSGWMRARKKVIQLVVGCSRVGRDYQRYCRDHLPYIEIVGFVDDRVRMKSGSDVLGLGRQLVGLVAKYRVDEVVMADEKMSTELMFNWLKHPGLRSTRFVFVVSVFDELFGRSSWVVDGLPTLKLDRVEYGMSLGKRVLDVLVAGGLLVLLGPFLLVLAGLTGLVFRRWPVLAQPRVGLGGQRFLMYKLVSMRYDDDRPMTRSGASRLGWYGRWLRRMSLDEWPQLVNVLKGEMSVVGPRPELWQVRDKFTGWRGLRHQVRPGLTGLWQVLGRKDLPLHQNVQYDIYYIYNQSLATDLKILLQTIPAVLSGRGAY